MKFTSIAWLFASIALFMEQMLGVPVPVLFVFILLNILEWILGVQAAISKGQAVESRKMGRAVLKTFTYVFLLGILNTLKKHSGGGEWYLFGWTYWFLFIAISLTLVRSIFENLHIMGVKEANVIYNALDNRFTRFIKEIAAPPSEEKRLR